MFTTFTTTNSVLSQTYDKPNFIPKFISGCTLWYDANDPYGTGSLPSVNSELSQWVDKSGNRNNATAKTINGVTSTVTWKTTDYYGTQRNCFSFIKTKCFDGTFTTITGPAMTVFHVAKISPSSQPSSRVLGFSTSNGISDHDHISRVSFLRVNSNSVHTYRNNIVNLNHDAVVSYNLPYMYVHQFTGSINSSTVYNKAMVSNTTSVSQSTNFNISYFTIAHNTNKADTSQAPLYGDISEIIMFNRSLTTTEVQKIEGYLAWKWDIYGSTSTNGLPTAHPYKNAPPNASDY